MKAISIQLFTMVIALHVATTVEGQIKRYKADKDFTNFNYAFAAERYEKIAKRSGADKDLAQKLADSYRLMNNSEEAEKWYSKVIAFPDSDPVNFYYYAEALKNNGNYMEARNQYLKYAIKVPEEKKKAEALAKTCETALEWMVNPVQIKIENRKDLNTEYSEFSPVLIKNNLIFATDRKLSQESYERKEIYGWTGTPYLYLMTAGIDSMRQFTVQGKINEIDHAYHNGPVSLSSKGDTLYFTRANKVKNPKKIAGKEQAQNFINRLEIYQAVNKNGKWQNIEPFAYNNISQYSIGHPALSPDGKTLYFSSDMPGSFGETDIYFCEKQKDGTWGKPTNLGKKVNSAGKELFPYVSNDGTLYFSSNGHPGMGGLDIFYAKGAKTTWHEVDNMKFPLNSPKDDFGIAFDSTGKSGFISSNREGGLGSDDIYHFRNPSCVVSGLTLEILKGTEKPLEDVMINLYRKGDTTELLAYERSTTQSVRRVCLRSYHPCASVENAKGTFFFNLQPGTYELKASKNGYFTQLATIEANCNGEDTIKIAMQLNKIELNKPIVLKDLFFDENEKLFVKKNIYYDLDRADIRRDAAMELDKLVELLKNNPNIKIELSAHTDSRHSSEYNLSLSQKRAEAAVKYIINKGIDKDKMVAKGYGESKLVNDCKDGKACDEEKHQQNRRTEIMITEIIEPTTHKVGAYDTLYSISRKYNISVEELKKLNNIQDEVIYAGDVIKVK